MEPRLYFREIGDGSGGENSPESHQWADLSLLGVSVSSSSSLELPWGLGALNDLSLRVYPLVIQKSVIMGGFPWKTAGIKEKPQTLSLSEFLPNYQA